MHLLRAWSAAGGAGVVLVGAGGCHVHALALRCAAAQSLQGGVQCTGEAGVQGTEVGWVTERVHEQARLNRPCMSAAGYVSIVWKKHTFCWHMHAAMLTLMLKHSACAADARLKMGICEGCPNTIMPDHLGRADYHGASINQAARYMDAAAHGGQVCIWCSPRW